MSSFHGVRIEEFHCFQGVGIEGFQVSLFQVVRIEEDPLNTCVFISQKLTYLTERVNSPGLELLSLSRYDPSSPVEIRMLSATCLLMLK